MLQTPSKTTQTLLSPRIPRDNEHERYHPELEEELKALRESEMWQTAVTVRKLRPENN